MVSEKQLQGTSTKIGEVKKGWREKERSLGLGDAGSSPCDRSLTWRESGEVVRLSVTESQGRRKSSLGVVE